MKKKIYTPPTMRVVKITGKIQLLDNSIPHNVNDPEYDW